MNSRPTILAFGASNAHASINQAFALHAARVLQQELAPDIAIDTIDLNDFEMPIYSPERERAGGIPAAAREFFARIGAADGLIISFAEHNGGYSAAFKNLFDWTSRIDMKLYQGRPMVLLATSPGPRGGQNVLASAVQTAPFFGGDVRGSLSVGPHAEAFDAATGRLVQPEGAAELRRALSALHGALAVPA